MIKLSMICLSRLAIIPTGHCNSKIMIFADIMINYFSAWIRKTVDYEDFCEKCNPEYLKDVMFSSSNND